jgi:hypothetical protein
MDERRAAESDCVAVVERKKKKKQKERKRPKAGEASKWTQRATRVDAAAAQRGGRRCSLKRNEEEKGRAVDGLDELGRRRSIRAGRDGRIRVLVGEELREAVVGRCLIVGDWRIGTEMTEVEGKEARVAKTKGRDRSRMGRRNSYNKRRRSKISLLAIFGEARKRGGMKSCSLEKAFAAILIRLVVCLHLPSRY